MVNKIKLCQDKTTPNLLFTSDSIFTLRGFSSIFNIKIVAPKETFQTLESAFAIYLLGEERMKVTYKLPSAYWKVIGKMP